MSVIVNMKDKLIGAADKPLWQYDYGQTVTIQNVDIPDGIISVQFEAQQSGGTISTAGTCAGGTITAEIPNQLLAIPAVWNYRIMAYVFAVTEDSGTTKYTAMLEVAHRGAQTDIEPTPEEQSAWDQAMAELAEYQEAINAQVAEIDQEVADLGDAVSYIQEYTEAAIRDTYSFIVNKTQELSDDLSNDISDSEANTQKDLSAINEKLENINEALASTDQALLQEEKKTDSLLERIEQAETLIADEAAKNIEKIKKLLPCLFLTGDVSSMSKDNAVSLMYSFGKMSGTCTVKWQGSSSLSYPKKNYTVKFDRKFEAKAGWGLQSKYVLKANWVDFSHSRNICSAKLWGELSKEHYSEYEALLDESGNNILDEAGNNITTLNSIFLTLPNAGSIDGFPILVFINDEFTGLFTMNIPKDGWMFGMTGANPYEAILCAEHGTNATYFTAATAVCDGSDYSIEYATDEDDTSWIPVSLNAAIQKVVDASDANFVNEIEGYIDLDSAIDYYIFSCLLNNYDGIVRNFLLATYDGQEWHFAAYDLDNTFGNYVNGSYFLPPVDYTGKIGWYGEVTFDSVLFNRLFLLIKTYIPERLKNRYEELRNGVLSESNVSVVFQNFGATIPKLVKDEEVKAWPNVPSSDANNLSQILNFYRLKSAAMDAEINNI